MKFRSLALSLLSFAAFFAGAASAIAKPGPVRNGQVSAELVAHDNAIQPGKTIRVAVKLDHDPHWHSYWINAGTGYPTSITWTLPEGFKAGPILWPTPHVVKDSAGKVTGNGYEGQVFLYVDIAAPADLKAGTNVTLKAFVEWLMCEDVCMPGDANIELTLPVKDEKAGPNMSIARLFNNAQNELPRVADDWAFSASRDGSKIVLRVAPKNGQSHKPSDLHYFDENNTVDYAAAQTVREDKGVFVIEMTASAEAPANAPGLKGILTSKNGWGPATSGGYSGIVVDTPFVVKEPTIAQGATTGAASGGDSSGGGTATGGGDAAQGSTTLVGTVFLAFLGGLVLNLMPCVFPVLGIKILGFVNQSGSDKSKVVQHGLAFTAGVLISFWALAGLLLALRAGGAQLGWGFQLQSPAFVFGMAAFLLIFALNMSGLFEIGLSATSAGAGLQSKEGVVGSFFTGALATLVATPCSAPFLAPALGAALALSAVESIIVFTAIAVGLALPYLLLSIFPQAIKMLPRPGAWMETFKQFMAFPLYLTVAWLLWVLAGQTSDDDYALLWISFAFVLIAMAGWAYGRFGQAYGKPARQAFGKVFAAALLVSGVWMGWPKDASAQTVAQNTDAGYQVVWQKWSPEAVAAAQAAGKYAYVDFTARWCATCQTNKATVFADKDVLQEFGKKEVVLFKADWTNRDPQITAELAKWKRSAVPFNLIYGPKAKDPIVLPELLTGNTVLQHLAKAE